MLQKGSKIELKCLPEGVFFDFGETLISCNSTMVLLDLSQSALKSIKKRVWKTLPNKT